MRHRGWIATFVVLAFGATAAVGEPADQARVLDCRIEGHVPEQPGVAEQGGYRFSYQSLRGVTVDDRACTVHRLRNATGNPPTPVRWTLGEVAVVDKVRLARCEGEGCVWLDFVRYFPGDVDTNLSELSYGLNADAYRETAETFMTTVGVGDSDAAVATGVAATSVGTEIAGRVATRDGTPVELHLIAKSRFEPDPAGGSRLIYSVTDLSGGAWHDGAIRVEWDAWDAIGVDPRAVATAASAQGGADVSVGAGAILAVVSASAFFLDDSFELRVFARGDDEPLAVVAMPAYVPVEPAP